MTSKKDKADKQEELDAVSAALTGANARYLTLLKAQAAQTRIGTGASAEMAKAKEVYDAAIKVQQDLISEAEMETEIALTDLQDYQAERSAALGINLDIIPQPAVQHTGL